MRQHGSRSGPLEHNLLGSFAERPSLEGKTNISSRYLAVHLRFEIDMAAYSMCYFGGGKDEEDELEAYRAVHFPALTLLKNTKKYVYVRVYRLFLDGGYSFDFISLEFFY